LEKAVSATLNVGDPCPDPDSVQSPVQGAVDPYYYTGDIPKLVFATTKMNVVPDICPPMYSCSFVSGPKDICFLADGDTQGQINANTGIYEF